MRNARIADIIDCSLVDGQGNRTVIFFQGCNFNCIYCHNPETIPKSLGKEFCVDELLNRISNNMPFIRGITVSGGECTLQADFIQELFRETRKLKLTNFIDTNGSVPLKPLNKLMMLTDGVMLDIKAVNPIEHKRITGKSNSETLNNARYLAESGKLIEVRTVVTGNVTENLTTIKEIADLLRLYGSFKNLLFKIIKYRPNGVRPEFGYLTAPSDEEMLNLKHYAILNGFFHVYLA